MAIDLVGWPVPPAKPQFKEIPVNPLAFGGSLTLLAAVLHVFIIVGGADWYRFFGAGETMAQMSEQGAWQPIITTAIIALILLIWSLYGFSGAGVIRPLPLLKTALAVIGTIFLLRGLLAVPALFLFESPHLTELKQKMEFMVVTSLFCLVLGLCYLTGFVKLVKR